MIKAMWCKSFNVNKIKIVILQKFNEYINQILFFFKDGQFYILLFKDPFSYELNKTINLTSLDEICSFLQ